MVELDNVNKFPIDVYADGPTIDEILELSSVHVRGYTFNPTLFKMLGVTDYIGHCRKLVEICSGYPISLEVIADKSIQMIRQARKLSSLGSDVYVKIPITFTSGKSTIEVMRNLVRDDIQMNITAILAESQVVSILPTIIDTETIISVFAGRVFDVGVDAVPLVKSISNLVHTESKCKVLWASPRVVYDIKNAIAADSDIITMKPDLIHKLDLFDKSLEEYSLDTVRMFYNDALTSGYSI